MKILKLTQKPPKRLTMYQLVNVLLRHTTLDGPDFRTHRLVNHLYEPNCPTALGNGICGIYGNTIG